MKHLLLIQLTCCPDCNLSEMCCASLISWIVCSFCPTTLPTETRAGSETRVFCAEAVLEADLVTGSHSVVACNADLTTNKQTGNEGGFFEMHDQTGDLFLVREIDLESLAAAVLTLQIQVKSAAAHSLPHHLSFHHLALLFLLLLDFPSICPFIFPFAIHSQTSDRLAPKSQVEPPTLMLLHCRSLEQNQVLLRPDKLLNQSEEDEQRNEA